MDSETRHVGKTGNDVPLNQLDSDNSYQTIKSWDVFEDPPVKEETGSVITEKSRTTLKIVKLLIYLFTFLFVTATAVLSKGSLIFITSNLKHLYVLHNNTDGSITTKLFLYKQTTSWIWSSILCFIVPEILVFFRSLRLYCFKSIEPPHLPHFFFIFITETFHTTGLSLLVFIVLPNLSVTQSAMITNCLCFGPATLNFITNISVKKKNRNIFKIILDVTALTFQISGIIVWFFYTNNIFIPLSLILTSMGWCENYVDKNSSIPFIKYLGLIKSELNKKYQSDKNFDRSRDFIYLFVSLWKIILFISTTTAIIYFQCSSLKILTFPLEIYPFYISILNIISSYICYVFAKFVCKIKIQEFSYAFPIFLTVPSTMLLFFFLDFLEADLGFQYELWIWFCWLLSQVWVTIHIWSLKCERLASSENIFVAPLYNGLVIDQSLAMNRKKHEKEEFEDFVKKENTVNKLYCDIVPRIIACATMWHETREEMIEFLKSIFRMDEDQSARRLAQEYLLGSNTKDPDYYEFETHIFFDDAFDGNAINNYVRTLVECIDQAASNVHEEIICLRSPKKTVTPYGGQLEWTLPGRNKMIAHLKDSSKIRHRKRWSQVMYMYYLFGHKLMQQDIDKEKKVAIGENTFLLALDGDIDFQPYAVHRLIDLMKKDRDKELGAACGRIHPVGSGPMVWYQLFEYAIGHWMQKATEHVIGCVLCSPGCFSLFRGSALMESSVMKKYTMKSQEARHYVQCDQGEDRWLCTLLLQQGFRVEYSAASDAYTHCPEGFNEFFNQRRRWIPSTMANIMDLLQDYKRIIKVNNSISILYIFYQTLLMVGTILGPGTIFLMLEGAFVAALGKDNWTSFYINLLPLLVFMFICLTCKSKMQLFCASILSVVYSLLMMVVLVGIILNVKNDGIDAPSSIFLFMISGIMIVAGLLHPQEIMCLPCGVVYFITVPSMYLLLIIYSLFNLNDVTWGTRESVTTKTNKKQNPLEDKLSKSKKSPKYKTLLRLLRKSQSINPGGMEFSLGEAFRCTCCPGKKPSDENEPLIVSDEIETECEDTLILEDMDEQEDIQVDWIMEMNGPVGELSQQETDFWNELLAQYLYPLIEDKDEKSRIAKKLKDLRDKAVFGFLMINALFVLIVFMLTLQKENINIPWPVGCIPKQKDDLKKISKNNTELSVEVQDATTICLQLEPVGLVFVFFFGLIMVIQFFSMLFHRLGTFAQILASIDLNIIPAAKVEDEAASLTISQAVEHARRLQSLKDDDMDKVKRTTNKKSKRENLYMLAECSPKEPKIADLQSMFLSRTNKEGQININLDNYDIQSCA